MLRRLGPLLLALFVSTSCIAAETLTKIVSFRFERLERGKYVSPEIPRNGLKAVVELRNGKILKAPLAIGGRDRTWYTALASFDEFDLAEAKYFGIEEATPNAFPARSMITGVRVSAFTKQGERRMIEQPGEVSRVKWTTRSGYSAFSAVDSSEAIAPWSEIMISAKVRDGLNRVSELTFNFDAANGQTHSLRYDGRSSASDFANNTDTTMYTRVPFEFGPGNAHRISIRLTGSKTGLSTDDIDFATLKVQSRGIGSKFQPVFELGASPIQLGLKGSDWWQSPILAPRTIVGGTQVSKLFYEVFTGSDDLRVDGAEERTRSRLSFRLTHQGNQEVVDSLPTIEQIRSLGSFGANGSCFSSFILPAPMQVERLNRIELYHDLGNAGSGFLNSLGEDNWSFSAIRVWFEDASRTRRVIYSNVLNTYMRRNSPRVAPMNFADQTRFVATEPAAPRKDGLPGVPAN